MRINAARVVFRIAERRFLQMLRRTFSLGGHRRKNVFTPLFKISLIRGLSIILISFALFCLFSLYRTNFVRLYFLIYIIIYQVLFQ